MTLPDISEIVANSKIRVKRVQRDRVIELERKIKENFNITFSGQGFPWEGSGKSIYDSNGWRLIERFVGNAHCIIIIENTQEVWEFENGKNLTKFLTESPGFEFYVCDSKASYLLCFNHHDYLIGWGAAKEWVHPSSAYSA